MSYLDIVKVEDSIMVHHDLFLSHLLDNDIQLAVRLGYLERGKEDVAELRMTEQLRQIFERP